MVCGKIDNFPPKSYLTFNSDCIPISAILINLSGVDSHLGHPTKLFRTQRKFCRQFCCLFWRVEEGHVRLLEGGGQLEEPLGNVEILGEDLADKKISVICMANST